MQLPSICGGLITSMAGYRTTVHGVAPAKRAATRASPMPIGSAPAAATVSILKRTPTIRTSSTLNHRTARCLASTCAPAALPAFVRAPRRVVAVEAGEGAGGAAVARALGKDLAAGRPLPPKQ